MALVYQKLTLEVTPGMIPPVLHVTEYDVNMQIDVTFTQRGQPFQIPSGTTAVVEGTIAGHPFRNTSATASGNTVTFELTESMTAFAGRAWTKIKLTQNNKPVSTCGFWLDCDRAGVEADTIIGASGFEEQIQNAVDNYLEEHPVGVEVDPTLSIEGAAADAKVTGDEIGELKSVLKNDVYPVIEDLGYSTPILTTSDFEYGAYLSTAGRRTDGAYGYLKSADEMLPVEDIVITLSASDVGTTNYVRTIALYNDGVFRTNYETNTPFVNGVANISASSIQSSFPGANGMRINVGVLEGGSFVMFPASTGITVTSAESVPITSRVSVLEAAIANKKYYIVDQNGNGDYTSLYVAVNALPENSLIFVKPGEYLIPNSRYLSLRDKGMFIIGEDRDSCIITSYDGRYEYPAVWANSGLLENLTIQSIYLSGTSNEIDANTNGAYAVHYDQESSVGKTLTIRNCKMISDFNCGIGIGMRKDATLNIEDCFIHANQITGRGKYNYGALLVHDSIGVQGAQYFNLINCALLSNLGVTMTVNNSRGGDNVVYCKMLNNTLKDAQNGYANNVVLGNTPFASVFVKSMCHGNSNSELNEA